MWGKEMYWLNYLGSKKAKVRIRMEQQFRARQRHLFWLNVSMLGSGVYHVGRALEWYLIAILNYLVTHSVQAV